VLELGLNEIILGLNGMFHFWVTLFRTKVTKVIKKQKFFGEQKQPKLQRNKSSFCFFVTLATFVLKKSFCFFVTFVTFVLKSVTYFCREMKHAKIISFNPNSSTQNGNPNPKFQLSSFK
jgi:hypothetical protein